MKIINCKKCGRDFKKSSYYNHYCLSNRSKFYILEEWKTKDDLYKCPECTAEFSKMGLIGHYYRKHDVRGIDFLENRLKNSKKQNKVKLSKEEISKRISEGMKKCYSEGRHPGWSHVNLDKNRRSYPEKFFIEVFNNNLLYDKYVIEEKYPFGKYSLDFLFIDLGLVIEIDGSQHFRNIESIKHDIVRDEYLNKNGLKVYRIKWSDVCNNPKKEIEEMLFFISNIENEIGRKYNINNSESDRICECGGLIKTKKSKICNTCRSLNNRVVKERPSYETLLFEIEKMGYVGTGRKYGVSDNAIRKWIKNYISRHNEI
jgi:very-short-patch-repair endonuclease